MNLKPRHRYRGLALGAMLVVLAMVTSACGDDSNSSTGTTVPTGSIDSAASTTAASTSASSIRIGKKDFAGAQLLSELYGQALASKLGTKVSYDQLGPSEQTYAALKSGDIDLYGEYQGTLLTVLKGTPTGDADATNAALQDKLTPDGTIVSKPPSTAVDVNGFYVTKETAAKYNLKKLSDLVAVAPTLTFGGPPECGDRPLCLGSTEQSLYNLQFKEVKKLDSGGPNTVAALKGGDIQVGLLFTGSSPLDPDFVLLSDDKGLQPADDAVAVWSKTIDSPGLDSVIASVNGKLDTKAYSDMLNDINTNKSDPTEVATKFLKDNGLA